MSSEINIELFDTEKIWFRVIEYQIDTKIFIQTYILNLFHGGSEEEVTAIIAVSMKKDGNKKQNNFKDLQPTREIVDSVSKILSSSHSFCHFVFFSNQKQRIQIVEEFAAQNFIDDSKFQR